MRFRQAFGGGVYVHSHGTGTREPTLTWEVNTGSCVKCAAAQLEEYSFVKLAQLKLICTWPSDPSERRRAAQYLSKLKSSDSTADVKCCWPYIAGFFDAEGSISVSAKATSLVLKIGQKHKNVLTWMHHFLEQQCGQVAGSLYGKQGYYSIELHSLELVQNVLHRLLVSGLLVKRAHAQAALTLQQGTHTQLREQMAQLVGNQGRYHRLNADGCVRAREINLINGKLRHLKCLAKDKEADLVAQHLSTLKQKHEYANAAAVHSLLQLDLRSLMARGAVLQERSTGASSAGLRKGS